MSRATGHLRVVSGAATRDLRRVNENQWRRWESNPLPLACHASALPTELRPRRDVHVTTSLCGRMTGDETPKQRYTAALANEIEHRWQDRWESEHVFWTPNREGLLAEDPRGIAGRPHRFVLDMFPYPSGVGLHVGHPLGYIATDVYSRFLRMNGFNVLHAMGYDAFGLPAEQYAVQTGTHPRVTTERNVDTMKAQMRALGLAHDPRRGPATTDVAYYKWTQWIFLQIYNSWYDEDANRGRPDRPAGAGVPRWPLRNPERHSLRRARPARTTGADRCVPARVRRGGAGQLVPRLGHRAGERRSHRRRPQRTRQLPRVSPAAQAVDAAHHVVRRPATGRPRPAGLVGVDQVDATQLDRSFDGRHREVPRRRLRGHRDRGLHDAARHVVRRHVHGARARASVGRRDHRERMAGRRHRQRHSKQRARPVEGHFRCERSAAGRGAPLPRVRIAEVGSRTASGRRRHGEDGCVHRRVPRSTPPTTSASRSSSPTTC